MPKQSTSPSPRSDPRPDDSRSSERINADLERRRVELKLKNLNEMLARQKAEMETFINTAEQEGKVPKLRIGKKTASVLMAAEERARYMEHRAVGTEDLLWALLHDSGETESTAFKFLKSKGVTKEVLYAKHRYSDNAAQILRIAAQHSSDLNKGVVGTGPFHSQCRLFHLDQQNHFE